MRERAFLGEFGASLRACGAWWYKMPDPAREEFGTTRRFPEKRPFDGVFFAPHGLAGAIEAKIIGPGERVVLEPHQHEHLRQVSALGYQGWIVVRAEVSPRRAEVFVIQIGVYDYYLAATGKKGVPFKQLPVLGKCVERTLAHERRKGMMWDVRTLLDMGARHTQQPLVGVGR